MLDTDVVVAAMRSPGGASAELIRRIRLGAAEMVLSVPLALEYEAICTLAEHRMAGGLQLAEVLVFIDRLIQISEYAPTRFSWRPQLRDPDDEMVLEAALNGQAGMIVTFNLRDYGKTPERFGLEAIRPGDALKRILA